MTIDWWTLGLQTLNFIVLVWILARYLFRPVSRIIAERQAAAHAALDAAEAAKVDAIAARAVARDQSDAIAAERATLMTKARADAEAERRHLLESAQAETERLRAAARDEIEKMHAAEQHRLAKQAGVFAADIAERLLQRLPDSARIDGFVDGLAEAVANLPASTRTGIGREGPVSLRAGRQLTDAEIAHVKKKLEAVLNRNLDLQTETDPTLIAGLELDAPNVVVSNHFRSDLDRIVRDLSGDD